VPDADGSLRRAEGRKPPDASGPDADGAEQQAQGRAPEASAPAKTQEDPSARGYWHVDPPPPTPTVQASTGDAGSPPAVQKKPKGYSQRLFETLMGIDPDKEDGPPLSGSREEPAVPP
jgi:hypothetical protein